MINRKRILIASLILLIFLSTATIVYSSSEYVLPYPSYMPGNKLYAVHVVIERFSKYWYFGDFGQFIYNLKQSDKYLVEAKTLFEYKQYLLGYKALKKSDAFFAKTKPALESAVIKGKNTTEKRNILKTASIKHIEILNKIILEVPKTFNWIPENDPSTNLMLHKVIQESILARVKI